MPTLTARLGGRTRVELSPRITLKGLQERGQIRPFQTRTYCHMACFDLTKQSAFVAITTRSFQRGK